ncbi:MAG: endonuclease III [Oscillospiraceae bacterium]
MIIKERLNVVFSAFNELYPDAKCSLNYTQPHELLIACRLSAQCTDARVNLVTKPLFERYKTLSDFANADVFNVEEIVKSCGLYKTKAKSIVEMSRQILTNFGGELPSTIEELTTLSGVGRKTANLILGDIFGLPAIVTDTHCIRISRRLGLTKSSTPPNVEKDLLKIIPKEISSKFCHQIVWFGRDFCKAQSPKCDVCPIRTKSIELLKIDYICKL